MSDLEPIGGELVSDDEYLERLASRVREESRNLKVTMVDTVESMFVIGQCLQEARQALASNEAYGAWFSAQGFDFTPAWGRVLRMGSVNESLVRPAIASQLAKGNTSVNFEQTVKRVVGTSKPKRTPTEKPDWISICHMLAAALRGWESLDQAAEDASGQVDDPERIAAEERLDVTFEQVWAARDDALAAFDAAVSA